MCRCEWKTGRWRSKKGVAGEIERREEFDTASVSTFTLYHFISVWIYYFSHSAGKVASKTLNSIGVPASYGSQSDREPLIQYAREDDSDAFNVSISYRTRDRDTDSDSLINFAEFSVGPESNKDSGGDGASAASVQSQPSENQSKNLII